MLKVGAVLYPVALILAARRMPSPVSAFRKAGAFSPETARKPGTLGLSGAWMFEGAVKSGLVKATGDGRYYLDEARDRRRQRVFWAAVGGFIAVTTPVLLWAVW